MRPQVVFLFSLSFSLTPVLSQEGGGQLFERVFRGLAHAVASENGSALIPPPIPYDPQAANRSHSSPQAQNPVRQESAQPRNWYQPPPVNVPPRTQTHGTPATPSPRIFQQPQSSGEANPSRGTLSGWYQPPPGQAIPQYHSPAQTQVQTPAQTAPNPSPFGGFTPLREAFSPTYVPPPVREPQVNHGANHAHQGSPSPWIFGPRNTAPVPSYHSHQSRERQTQNTQSHHPRVDHHGHSPYSHSHNGQGSHHPQEKQKIIAVTSQFQPFSIFQRRSSRSVISSRSVTPAPNRGTVVWFKVR